MSPSPPGAVYSSHPLSINQSLCRKVVGPTSTKARMPGPRRVDTERQEGKHRRLHLSSAHMITLFFASSFVFPFLPISTQVTMVKWLLLLFLKEILPTTLLGIILFP